MPHYVASHLGIHYGNYITHLRVTSIQKLYLNDQTADCFFLIKLKRKYLFELLLYIPVNMFSVMSDGSSWVEPVLSKDKCVLHKDTAQ